MKHLSPASHLQAASDRQPCHEITLRQLTPADLPAMLDLQARVFEALPEESKNFIVPKKPQQIMPFLEGDHYGVGCFSGGKLVAQRLLFIGRNGAAPKGLTDCAMVREICAQHQCYGVTQSTLVCPDYRKHGLMRKMIAHITQIAEDKNISAIFSEVAAGNVASATGLTHHGYKVVGTATDPSDGADLIILKQDIASPVVPLVPARPAAPGRPHIKEREFA